MSFQFTDLDSTTRQFMLEEINLDITNNTLYMSKRFNNAGSAIYPDLLRKAVSEHNEVWLTQELRKCQCMKLWEERKTRRVRVPVTAAKPFAEGEFNRFYIRGLCAKTLSEGKTEVEVYRAKAVS